jgi:hypothetical protein
VPPGDVIDVPRAAAQANSWAGVFHNEEREAARMLSKGKKFPLNKFYQFATHNGWREDADAIRETTWPVSERKKRTNTAMRRLEAVWFLEEKGKLAEFKRRHWS